MSSNIPNDPINMLHKRLTGRSQRSLALEIPCSAAYLSDVLLGKRPPGPKMLKFLGLKKVIRYEYVRAK